MKRQIIAKKSDNRLVGFGFENTDRFSPVDYDIVETNLENLPDEMRFCKYENKQIVIDETYKQQTLDAEAQVVQDRIEANQQMTLEDLASKTYTQIDTYIENNVTNLASAIGVLKKLAKWNLALTKYLRIKRDDQ